MPTSAPPSSEADSEDEYASRDAVEARLAGKVGSLSGSDDDEKVDQLTSKTSEMTVGGDAPLKKIGMAKAKKQKKAARQAAAQQEGHPCFTCRATFDSKGALFKHIKENPDHAAPRTAPTASKSKKKRR